VAGLIDEIERLFRKELAASDLATLKKAFAAFVRGTPEEAAAAEAIARNAQAALAAYLDGDLSRTDLRFVLRNAERGYRALVDAKVLRIRKTALRVFYRTLTGWLLRRI
jgi:hypothetical protein